MRKSKYTKELLEPIVKNSTSVSNVLASLGLKNTGGNYRYIQAKIKNHDISMDHFLGQGWSKGKKGIDRKNGYTDDQVFVKKSPIAGSSGGKLRERMLRNGWIYKCAICHIDSWLGDDLSLDVDHIDGDHTNNEKTNLRFLCPNCHKQTNTWGNKKTINVKSELGKKVWIDVAYTLLRSFDEGKIKGNMSREMFRETILQAHDLLKQNLIEGMGLKLKRINGEMYIEGFHTLYDVDTGEDYSSD